MSNTEKSDKDMLQRLFEAASIKFGETGYSETTMDSIAEEAGVSKGSLYYYFDSKEELFLKLLRNWLDRFESRWKDLSDGESPLEELVQLHRMMIAAVDETASFGRLMLEFWANASRKKKFEEMLNRMLSGFRENTANLIKKGIDRGTFRQVDPWEASSALIAAYDGILFHWLLDPESFDLEGAGKELITNFVRGLGVEGFEYESIQEGEDR